MLEKIDPGQFERLIEKIDCHVELPPDLAGHWEETGIEPGSPFEHRRWQRKRIRCRAILEITGPLPAFPRSQTVGSILTRNLSRNGLGFLYHEQLFPDERVQIGLPGCLLEGRIARCRRRGPNCYELGIEFLRGGERTDQYSSDRTNGDSPG